MTAEIAIMNQQAIALATDSAVTVGSGTKIYPSANKLFNLSKFCPIGIMVYSDANFMGVNWETIIKIYRRILRSKELDSVEDYAKDFIGFLCSRKDLFPREQQIKNAKMVIENAYLCLLNDFASRLKTITIKKKADTKIDSKMLLSEVILAYYENSKSYEMITNLDGTTLTESKINEILDLFKKDIQELKKRYFGGLSITSQQSFKLTQIAQSALLKIGFTNSYTGIVFAGYGKTEVFPAVCRYRMEYIINDILKFKKEDIEKISFENDAVIIPFAQSDVVKTFVEGIDPEYKKEISKRIRQTISRYGENIKNQLIRKKGKDVDKLIESISARLYKELDHNLATYEHANYVKPIIDIVVNLPKAELASMAESMVNLTSFKRRVSRSAETVGGPIDVALISKGDGFVWIKRKHYFEPKLNHQFFENYYREMEDE